MVAFTKPGKGANFCFVFQIYILFISPPFHMEHTLCETSIQTSAAMRFVYSRCFLHHRNIGDLNPTDGPSTVSIRLERRKETRGR